MLTETAYLDMLLAKSVLSHEEKQWLQAYISRNDTPELRELLLNQFAGDLLLPEADEITGLRSRELLERIHRSLDAAEEETPVVPFFKRRMVAAACLLMVLASGLFYFLQPKKTIQQPVTARAVRTDVAAPKTNRATIILANGQQVVLDSTGSGTLAMQGDVRIEKAGDGSVSYHGAAMQNVYNTLFNPRGSKPISLTLSDGTKVWLNSESSLRYPVSFAGIERKVEVTGEAYLEVQKMAGSSFFVSVGGKGTIEVLGTHFNVNSYPDESDTRITLLEGKILLSLPGEGPALKQTVNIKPGQQAAYRNTPAAYNAISLKTDVNLDAVMAWKNGFFNFDNADLAAVMRQLARWYDIKVTYEGKIAARKFGGEIQRDLNLSEVLKLLAKNNIHYTIQNNELIVKP